MLFKFEAIDKEGKAHKGYVEARDREWAVMHLLSKGYDIQYIEETDDNPLLSSSFDDEETEIITQPQETGRRGIRSLVQDKQDANEWSDHLTLVLVLLFLEENRDKYKGILGHLGSFLMDIEAKANPLE